MLPQLAEEKMVPSLGLGGCACAHACAETGKAADVESLHVDSVDDRSLGGDRGGHHHMGGDGDLEWGEL